MLAILDYKAGNQTSVLRALRHLDIPGKITAQDSDLFSASGIIFPGVGAAGQAMRHLRDSGLAGVLRDLTESGKPLLGICLGCQILLEHSDEGDTSTLGIIRGGCRRFSGDLRDEEGRPINIPHMGWNSLRPLRDTPLLCGIDPGAEFYFVHAYYVEPEPELVLAQTRHGLDFCSVYGKDGLWAVQFHPEKSGPAGLTLLRNFYRHCQKAKRQAGPDIGGETGQANGERDEQC
ncbi:MAG: imidazole glycerol phosphate synthase subunit HisH [Desulfovibrio sp.]|jgi:glutamine amidotransferase|nr:imidazole glycerol phosphate synthase subunit HisH [Desulfovibrio sp.]